MNRAILGILLVFVCLLPTSFLRARDSAPQVASAAETQGRLFDSLIERYGVHGDDEAGTDDDLKTRIAEVSKALPADDPERSARLDAFRCNTQVDGTDEALKQAESGLAGPSERHEPLVRMEFLMCKAGALFDKGDRSDYVAPLNEVLQLADSERYPRLRSGALQMLSFYESDLGHYAQALSILREVLAMDQQRGVTDVRIRTEVLIAGMYIELGFYERASEVLLSVEKDARSAGRPLTLAMVLENQGRADEQASLLDAALAKYREAAEQQRLLGANDHLASLMLHMARVHALAGRLDDARSARADVDRLLVISGVPEAMRARRGYIDALIALESGNAGRAAQLLPDVVQRLRADDQPRPLVEALALQARAYRELGQWRAALEAREEQVRQSGRLDQRMQREQAHALAAELALSQAAAEKQRLQLEADAQRLQLVATQQEQRLRLIAIVLLALLLCAVAGLLLLTHRRLRGARYDAMTDSLTGIASRRHLLEHLAHKLSDRRTSARPLSVLSIDIDHFKQINDRFGHATGDEVLLRVTRACRCALREADKLGRMGGEEFMAVLQRTSLAEAEHLANRLCEAVAALAFDDVASDLHATVSIGVAEAAADDGGADDLLLRVDAALYDAKRGGRNCVRVAT